MLNQQKEGNGELFLKDALIYSGGFLKGEKHSLGKELLNGDYYETKYNQGKLIECKIIENL